MKQPFCLQSETGDYVAVRPVSRQEIIDAARRLLKESITRTDWLTSPGLTREYLQLCLVDREREVFACLYLTNRHRVIAFEELFFGTIDTCSVHPQEVVRRALHHNAAAVIFAHNHPSGDPEPSRADELLTQRLKEALGLIDVRVLDHIVVGIDGAVSLAERGLM